jgi:hypothetical protein
MGVGVPEGVRHVALSLRAQSAGGCAVPSDTEVCPHCHERIEASAIRCRYCQSDLPDVSDHRPSSEPHGDEEVLVRDVKRWRHPVVAAVTIAVVVLVAYGAILVRSSLRPPHHSQGFNIFVMVENACEQDDGNLVTTDEHGTPMAFATPDGPERYWCVSRKYLTSIGRGPQDPPPKVSRVPSEFKWRWPSTTYGR